MSGKRSHRLLRTWILPLVLLAVAAPAGAAARLIHMQNGKVLRAESVTADGEWLVVDLDGGDSLGFRAELVALVEVDLGVDNVFGTSLNVVTSGRYVPRGRSGGFNRQSGRTTPNNALTEGRKPGASQPQPGGVVVPAGQKVPPDMQNGGQQRPAQGVNLTPGRQIPRLANRPRNN